MKKTIKLLSVLMAVIMAVSCIGICATAEGVTYKNYNGFVYCKSEAKGLKIVNYKGNKTEIDIPEGGSFDDIVALKGNKNIGEGIDKIIAKLAEANELQGIIDNAHFNDETKLGKGDEMVEKLTGLISIFQRPEFDFSNNRLLLVAIYIYPQNYFVTI